MTDSLAGHFLKDALRDRKELRSSAHFNQTSVKSCDNADAPLNTLYTTAGAAGSRRKKLSARGFADRIAPRSP